MESNIFNKVSVDINKLIKYGFIKDNNKYLYEDMLNNEFKIIIIYDIKFNYEIYDIEFNEIYDAYKIKDNNGEFVNNIRLLIDNKLNDIKNNCCNSKYFISNQANRINKYISDKYNINPEFLFKKYDDIGIFRNNHKKWFGLIMSVSKDKILKNKDNINIEILNIKIDKDKLNDLLKISGIYECYHMNKKSWITIILDDTVDDNYIFNLIDRSYALV